MRRAAAWALLGLASVAAWGQPAPEDKLRRLMEAAGGRAAATAPSDERLRERDAWLAKGEAALAARDTITAEQAFDQAAGILHAADTELGLVRTYLQSGQYRRALAYGSHTAGAHLDVVGGAALYAWLLHLGGQEAMAQRLLVDAHARAPAQPLLVQVRQALAEPVPRPRGAMLRPPARLAPYASAHNVPAAARVVASGTLLDSGTAVVPASALKPGGRYWVRNALGDLAPVQIVARDAGLGLAWLKLATPLPAPEHATAPAAAFPGSVAYALDYPVGSDAGPAWPQMRAGFVGAALAQDGQQRALPIALGARSRQGGPVYDQAGRLAGVVVRDATGPKLVPPAQLTPGKPVPLAPGSAAVGRRSPDQIYEQSLKAALQFIRA